MDLFALTAWQSKVARTRQRISLGQRVKYPVSMTDRVWPEMDAKQSRRFNSPYRIVPIQGGGR